MSLRAFLHEIPDLNLSKRLQMMTPLQLNDYAALLTTFVEQFPEEEAVLRTEMEAEDADAVVKRLLSLRETLINIHADELAAECWKRSNAYERSNPDRVMAYASFLIAMLAALSIDIQMAFFKAENTIPKKPAQPEIAELIETPEDKSKDIIKTILAVDDDIYFLNTFKATLSSQPYHILSATSGKTALAMLAEAEPDLVVLDIEMPVMDGVTLAGEIKKSGCTAPIVFITGNATKEHVLRCLKAGASDFIVKPINVPHLINKFEKILAG